MEKIMKRTILLMVILIWLLVPTFTPDDVFVYWLIGVIGLPMYLLLLGGVLLLMWHYKINLSIIKKTIGGLFKKWFK